MLKKKYIVKKWKYFLSKKIWQLEIIFLFLWFKLNDSKNWIKRKIVFLAGRGLLYKSHLKFLIIIIFFTQRNFGRIRFLTDCYINSDNGKFHYSWFFFVLVKSNYSNFLTEKKYELDTFYFKYKHQINRLSWKFIYGLLLKICLVWHRASSVSTQWG